MGLGSTSLDESTKEDKVVLHYRTGWETPLAHLSCDEGASWSQLPFRTSRLSPVGPDFRVVELPSAPARFVLTDGAGGWDNPSSDCEEQYVIKDGGEGNYCAPSPGSYVLFAGKLSKVEGVLRRKGLAVVTDIDGTLFGCEESLARFYDLWCRELALSGAYLVYNTGRGIESVIDLIREHRPIMPIPVAVVTRCGGYVHWFRNVDEASTAPDGDAEWKDFELQEPSTDFAYRKQLVEVDGWDEKCMPFCREVMNSLIAQGVQANWLYDGTDDVDCLQICLSVHTDSIDETLLALREELNHLPVKIITSGMGDFRYMDLTVGSGGKLGGTKYVVSQLPGESGDLSNAVFCGDSGNDIDALLGDVRGIVVGNAQPDLLLAHETRCSDPEPSLFKVLSVEAGFAGGIIEGLGLHGFI